MGAFRIDAREQDGAFDVELIVAGDQLLRLGIGVRAAVAMRRADMHAGMAMDVYECAHATLASE